MPGGRRTSTTQTAIESYRDGWAWSVPLSPTRRQCTVMIETGRSGHGSAKAAALAATYARELAKAAMLSARLAGARQLSIPWACDASIYDAVRAADEGVLLVGDAASFIEPLSSAGVKKALLSAWRAAVVANTCLSNQSLAGAAADLYAEPRAAGVRRLLAEGAGVLRRGRRCPRQPVLVCPR